MEPGDTGNCYTLTPDTDVYSAVFRLNLGSTGYTAFFAEHVPTEFERSAHYFIDKKGVDIEPLHELPEAEEAHAEYGGVIAACIVVNLCTLIGLRDAGSRGCASRDRWKLKVISIAMGMSISTGSPPVATV